MWCFSNHSVLKFPEWKVTCVRQVEVENTEHSFCLNYSVVAKFILNHMVFAKTQFSRNDHKKSDKTGSLMHSNVFVQSIISKG